MQGKGEGVLLVRAHSPSARTLDLGEARARSLELPQGLPRAWRRSSHLSLHLLPVSVHVSRKLDRSEGSTWSQALQ